MLKVWCLLVLFVCFFLPLFDCKISENFPHFRGRGAHFFLRLPLSYITPVIGILAWLTQIIHHYVHQIWRAQQEIVQHKQHKPTLTWRECYPITFGVKKPADLGQFTVSFNLILNRVGFHQEGILSLKCTTFKKIVKMLKISIKKN